MRKNCLNCKHIDWGYYNNNKCKNLKASKDLGETVESICNQGLPRCAWIYGKQNLESHDDCKYFEMSFATKIAIFKNKICRKIFEYKFNKIK